jgi:type II secretory pathway pseudopilin PulG
MILSLDKARMKRGFTLTEAAIVLGIVGLILGAIWVAASAVYSNMRVSTANTQLMQIVQNIRSLYASSTQMSTATTTAELASAGAFPTDTNPAAGTPRDGWGGLITITYPAAGGVCPIAGDCFAVNFAGVPQDACVKMAVSNGGQGRDSGLVGISNVASNVGTVGVGANATPATFIALGCANAPPAVNTISFTFRLKG